MRRAEREHMRYSAGVRTQGNTEHKQLATALRLPVTVVLAESRGLLRSVVEVEVWSSCYSSLRQLC